jgi:DOPA 4,5-dioxygenase
MDKLDAPDETINGYHAHIYYTAETKPVAARIREDIGNTFTVALGRWHDVPVGPHSAMMYQVAFEHAALPHFIAWLMFHRNGLNVRVHPLPGDDYEDHATFSLWPGPVVPLRLDVLRHRL